MLYELPMFEHMDMKSAEETVFWLGKYREKAAVIAGGTDLLCLLKDRVEGPRFGIPKVLLNIKTIPEINKITYDDEAGLRIGAAVAINDVETSGVIRRKFSVLSQAAGQVGTTQIRNMGTIGGNICQRPRCMYFRHPHFLCYKKGGDLCYAISGEHRYYHSIIGRGICAMAHPSDIAPALVALEARVIIAGPEGTRQMPLQDFFVGPNSNRETVVKSDELLIEVQVPNQEASTHQLFLKRRIRHSSDFSLSSVATVAQISNEVCEIVRIVLGGVAPFPYTAFRAQETVQGRKLNEELILQAAEAAVEEARPLPMNRYKVYLTKALVRRALTSMWRERSCQ